jgi:rhodanese-related sulfurtransferase
MRNLVMVLALVSALASPGRSEDAPTTQAPSMTPAELQSRRAAGTAPLVIDVRTPEEYATGHIPGALNIPYDQIDRRVSELRSENGVALYCMLGPRARKGEAALLAAGHSDVFHIEGGLAAWKQADLPIEDPQR